MTLQERMDLEIEMNACLITADQLCRGDGYIDSYIKEIVDNLREKAATIKKILSDESTIDI